MEIETGPLFDERLDGITAPTREQAREWADQEMQNRAELEAGA